MIMKSDDGKWDSPSGGKAANFTFVIMRTILMQQRLANLPQVVSPHLLDVRFPLSANLLLELKCSKIELIAERPIAFHARHLSSKPGAVTGPRLLSEPYVRVPRIMLKHSKGRWTDPAVACAWSLL